MFFNMLSLQRQLLVRTARIGVRSFYVNNALRKNLYETLGLTKDATQAEIKKAYFELSKLYHPDKISDKISTEENLAKFRDISAAYEVLGNEHSRKLYDRGLIGDLRKPGVDEVEEADDPLVNFYRKRQLSKADAKESDKMEAWSQTYYAEVKKRAKKRHELFSKSATPESFDYEPTRFFLDVIIAVVVGMSYLMNISDTTPNRALRKFLSIFE